jgi:RNA polymerase sigma factor (sigma-70 family)
MSERAAWFENLFRQTRGDLLRYLVRRTGDPEEAADLLAETYLIAWRRLEAVPPGEEARLWLFGVARNLLRKRPSRSRTAEAVVDRLAAELRAAQQLQEPAVDERADAVLGALARLGEGDRELLTLSAWEGLNPAEIATVLGISPNRARVRLHRARARLRAQLGRAGVPQADAAEAEARRDHLVPEMEHVRLSPQLDARLLVPLDEIAKLD